MTNRRQTGLRYRRWMAPAFIALVAGLLLAGSLGGGQAEAGPAPCVALQGGPPSTKWDCDIPNDITVPANTLNVMFSGTGGRLIFASIADPELCVVAASTLLPPSPFPPPPIELHHGLQVRWETKCIPPQPPADPAIVRIRLTLEVASESVGVDVWDWGNVGGIAELPDAAGTSLEGPGSSGRNAGLVAGVAVAIAAGAVALGGGALGAGWYARRRRR